MIKSCECGCGLPAPVATRTFGSRGIRKGQPMRFIRNHHFKGIRGAVHPRWKGGINHHGDGYIFELCPTHPSANRHGYVAQHRLVMEKKIGHDLTSNEIVHHLNHNPSDNRVENLSLETRTSHAVLHGNFPKPCRIGNCDRRHKRQSLCDTHAKYATRNKLDLRTANLPVIPRRKLSRVTS